jgi:hypothetical protein
LYRPALIIHSIVDSIPTENEVFELTTSSRLSQPTAGAASGHMASFVPDTVEQENKGFEK